MSVPTVITRVDFGSGIYRTILGIDGTGDDSITLDSDIESGIVEGIYGLKLGDSPISLQVNNLSVFEANSTWSKTYYYNSAPYHSNSSIRQLHLAASRNGSGVGVRVTIKNTSASTISFAHVCFAERETDGNAAGVFGGDKFQELLFSGASGVSIAGYGTATSDWLDGFVVDESKDYMTIMTYNSTVRFAWATGDGNYYRSDGEADWNAPTIGDNYTYTSTISYGVSNVEIKAPVSIFSDAYSKTLVESMYYSTYSYWALRQVFTPSEDGTGVRITLTALDYGMEFSNVTIAEQDSGSTTVGTYGSATFKSLQFNNAPNIYVPASSSATSDVLRNFSIDKNKKYLIHMDYGAYENGWSRALSGDGCYYKSGRGGDFNLQSVVDYSLASDQTYNVSKVEVITDEYSHVTPSDTYVAHTNAIQIDTSSWADISKVTVVGDVGEGIISYHAVSVNKGSVDEVWKALVSGVWRDIVQLDTGTWEYRDSSGNWQSASLNTRLGVLSEAFAVAENRMDADTMGFISSVQWHEVFVSGILDFACGLQANLDNIPKIDKYEVDYYV
jgi:hypothetical protein